MSLLERKIIAIAMLLTLLWGAGLFAVYMLQDSSATNSSMRTVLAVPEMIRANAPAAQVPAMLSVRGTLSFPEAATVVPVVADLGARQKRLASLRTQNAQSAGEQYGWEPRYTNQTGKMLPPTTAPANAATLITVHVTKASLRQALIAVATAAKMKVSIAPPGWLDQASDQPPIDLHADAKPLLEVVNELCCLSATQMHDTASGMWGGGIAAADPATSVINLEHQGPRASLGPWVISGRFSFEVQQVFHSSWLDPGPVPTAAQVTLKATHEPSLVVLGQSQQAMVAEAVDDTGHSLSTENASQPAPSPNISFAQIVGSMFGMRIHGASQASPGEQWMASQNDIMLQLQCPVDCGRTIRKLAGSERFLIQEKATRVELSVSSPPVQIDKTVDGVSITIDQWQVMSPQQIVFRLAIHHTDQDAQTWSRLPSVIQNINPVLLDRSGKALPAVRPWSNGQRGDDIAAGMFMCQQNGWGGGETAIVPAKLVVYVPTSFTVIDIPFEFNNLPLP